MVGVCDFLMLPNSVGANTNGGRQIAATSEYKSKVCAAVYLSIVIKKRHRIYYLRHDILLNSFEKRNTLKVYLITFGSNFDNDALRIPE